MRTLAVAMLALVVMTSVLKAEQIQLPQDGDQWHTSLFVHDSRAPKRDDHAAWMAFYHDPALVGLREQTHWHVYALADQMYRSRFQRHIRDEFPAVMVQRGDGEVVYKASGSNLHPDSLAGEIEASINRWECDNGRCRPVPHPEPEPTPIRREERVDRREEPVPDMRPGGSGWEVLAAVAVVCGLVGAAMAWSGQKRKR